MLGDKYEWMTVKEVLNKIDSLAKGFQQMGLQKQDKVIIYAETQVDWFLSCLAISKLNATVVTLFSNLGDDGVKYGMNQTKASFIVTTEELKNKLLTHIDRYPHLKTIIYIESPKSKVNNGKNSTSPPIPENINVVKLSEVVAKGSQLPPIQLELPKGDDIALIMYTSGTTSLPKAVIITHKQVMANIKSMVVAAECNDFRIHERTLASFLPLSHIFGFVFNLYMFVSKYLLTKIQQKLFSRFKFIDGGKIGFSTPFTMLNSSPGHVTGQVGDLRLLKPNTLVVVPLVLERFQKEIYGKLNKKSSLAAPLFTYFMDYKIRWLARGFDTPILNHFLCKKIGEEFGGNLNWIGVGGAPLHTHTQAFSKAALNVRLMNG